MCRVIIIGGGSSLNEGIEKGLWNHIRDRETWSINYAFKAMPYVPTKELWVDRTFFKNNSTLLEGLYKNGVECITKENDFYKFIPEIKLFKHSNEYNPSNGTVYTGSLGLSGMFALSLAVKQEYREIYLLGYDFGTNSISNDNTHFYQGKFDYVSSGVGNPQVYRDTTSGNLKKSVRDWDVYKDYKSIYNVSLVSNISSYPKLSWEEFFERIKTNEDSTLR
jgi:hypothetical protein